MTMPNPRVRRRALLLLVPTGLALAPVAARAHAVLMASLPAPAQSVPAGEHELRLRFNSRIDHARSRLALLGPDHAVQKLPLEPGAPVDELRAKAILSAGAYVVQWQVLATDGHITRGEVTFTVSGP